MLRLLFKFIIEVIGIRFYVTKAKPEYKQIHCLEVNLNTGPPLKYCFYLCPVQFNRYRFGNIRKTNGYRLGIVQEYEERHHSDFFVLGKDTMITFSLPLYRFFPLHFVFESLLSVYLKNLTKYIEASRSMEKPTSV